MATKKSISVKCLNRHSGFYKAHYLITTKNGIKIDVFIGSQHDYVEVYDNDAKLVD